MLTIKTIAKVCHEANRAYCQALGDDSQPSWEEAPEWQRQSAINGVNHVVNNADVPVSDLEANSHASWLKEKLETGWKYGPVKDVEKKEHPCCVPHEQLPLEQQLKDRLFVAVACALLEIYK